MKRDCTIQSISIERTPVVLEAHSAQSRKSNSGIAGVCYIKFCSKCKTTKSITEFRKNTHQRDGLQTYCKPCENKSKSKRPSTQKYLRKWCKLNSEKIALYRKNNPNKLWQNKNPDKMQAAQKKSYRKRIKDIKTRLSYVVRSGIRYSLRKNGKSLPTFSLLDFTIEELKQHLENQFQKGMLWGNYGEWEIDHIKPIASFNYNSPQHSDFKKCWALSNLQPLWAKENRKKSAKLI